MGNRLEAKVALITGGARGQGKAEARLFAEEGALVVVADVLDAEGEQVVEEIGPTALYVHLDVTDEAQWSRAIEQAESHFGRLDVLVNNAAIAGGAPLVNTTLADYRAIIEVNQVGVFLGMRSAVAPMMRAGGGSIVNVSSIDGLIGMAGMSAYVASKFAVRGMTKVAALELGRVGIRVNSLHPGYIDTPMLHLGGDEVDEANLRLLRGYPISRFGLPEEVAKLALFLASDDSSYCTGSEYVVDGGVTAGLPSGYVDTGA